MTRADALEAWGLTALAHDTRRAVAEADRRATQDNLLRFVRTLSTKEATQWRQPR